MAASLQDDDKEITDINVTPFVDVVLVLLIIFMVTARFMVDKNQGISVSLPQAATSEDTGPRSLALVLDKDSNLYLDGKAIDYEALQVRLQAESAQPEKPQALIAADEGTPHGSVIKLIDTIRRNGITDFAINVERGE